MNTRDQTAVAFYEAYKVAARRLGVFRSYESTDNLIRHYKRLAYDCLEEGYGDWMVEFDHDLLVRSFIEDILGAPELQSFEAFQQFRATVQEIDEVLKASFLTDFQIPFNGPWWSRGIVRKGYGDYADDVQLHYKIDLAAYQ